MSSGCGKTENHNLIVEIYPRDLKIKGFDW